MPDSSVDKARRIKPTSITIGHWPRIDKDADRSMTKNSPQTDALQNSLIIKLDALLISHEQALLEMILHARKLENAAISSCPPTTPPDELAWLIACKRGGALVGWLGLWDNEDYGWTLDPNKAIRFARQKDADMARSKWEVEDGDALSSEEHIWC